MSANIDKMSIVIKNYFSAECDMDTTIKQAYERGFRRGASACEALNMHICKLSDECGKLNEENAKLRKYAELYARAVKIICDLCPYCDDFETCGDAEVEPMSEECALYMEMRELGIEV